MVTKIIVLTLLNQFSGHQNANISAANISGLTGVPLLFRLMTVWPITSIANLIHVPVSLGQTFLNKDQHTLIDMFILWPEETWLTDGRHPVPRSDTDHTQQTLCSCQLELQFVLVGSSLRCRHDPATNVTWGNVNKGSSRGKGGVRGEERREGRRGEGRREGM